MSARYFTLANSWLVLAIIITLVVSIIGGDWIEGIAAISNVICVILVARKKISNYIWGILGVVLYGYISFNAGYYANGMLNVLYYLPLNLIGWYNWSKHQDEETQTVKQNNIGMIQKVFLLIIIIVGTNVLGWFLSDQGGVNSYADAFTAIASMIAMYLLVRRLKEQWVLWILVNIVTIWLWYNNYERTGEGLALIGMWSVMLINSIYGMFSWKQK